MRHPSRPRLAGPRPTLPDRTQRRLAMPRLIGLPMFRDVATIDMDVLGCLEMFLRTYLWALLCDEVWGIAQGRQAEICGMASEMAR